MPTTTEATNVSLTEHLERFVRERVASGRYNSASEVVRMGLRLLEQHEAEEAAKLEALRLAIQEGLDSGPPTPWDRGLQGAGAGAPGGPAGRQRELMARVVERPRAEEDLFEIWGYLAAYDRRSWLDAEDLAALDEQGISKAQLYGIIGFVGAKTISNYINHIAHTEADPQFSAATELPAYRFNASEHV